MKKSKHIRGRIKAHVKSHVKIYLPLLAVLLVVVAPAIMVSAYDEYGSYNSYGDNTWDYSGPTWTPSTYSNSGNSDYDYDSDSGGGSSYQNTTNTVSDGCSSIPAGAKQVIYDDNDIYYSDTNDLISEVTGKNGVSYIYMKNADGSADYNHIIGGACKVTKEQTWGYVYPEKIEAAKVEIEEEDEEEEEIPVIDSSKKVPPAGYEAPVVTSNPFSDVSADELEGEAAISLYNRAVVGGYDDGEFKGDRPVNRAEAAKMLLLAKKFEVGDFKNNGKFYDVVEGEWYTKYVVKAANEGIINGDPEGSFRPADTVNTAEFLKMLTKTFKLEENLDYSYYFDVDANQWYARYAGIAVYYDLFPERTGHYLYPSQKLTRKEVAIAIYKILLYFGD